MFCSIYCKKYSSYLVHRIQPDEFLLHILFIALIKSKTIGRTLQNLAYSRSHWITPNFKKFTSLSTLKRQPLFPFLWESHENLSSQYFVLGTHTATNPINNSHAKLRMRISGNIWVLYAFRCNTRKKKTKKNIARMGFAPYHPGGAYAPPQAHYWAGRGLTPQTVTISSRPAPRLSHLWHAKWTSTLHFFRKSKPMCTVSNYYHPVNCNANSDFIFCTYWVTKTFLLHLTEKFCRRPYVIRIQNCQSWF